MRKITIRPHAALRMRQRNITEAEVREALAQPKEKHFYNEAHGRMNVRHRFPNMRLQILVGYEDGPDETIVVTVIDEG